MAVVMAVSVFAGCSDKTPAKTDTGSIIESKKLTAVKSKYDDGLEMGVVSYDVVRDYGADNTGKEDATNAINDALFQAQVEGGGTVYLPEGKYLVTEVITVPSNVVLRGEWQSPHDAAPASSGTVLIADNDSAFTVDPVIFLNESGGIQNITVIYPNQSVEAPIEYYYAIEIGYYRCFTIENTTVLGAWNGIALGHPDRGNEIYYLRNTYISALNIGVFNHKTSDTGRMEQVEVSPDFWIENGLYPMDDSAKEKTRSYFREHARGFEFYLNDWSVAYDISVSDLNIGMYFGLYSEDSRAMNGKFMNVTMENCDTGIYLDATKLAGVDFTNLKITTDWASSAAINSSTTYNGSCMFYNAEISGPFKNPVINNGMGQVSTSGAYNFVSGSVSGWNPAEGYAVTVNGGSVTLQDISFGESAKHIVTSGKIQSLSVLGCTFAGTPDISVPASAKADCDIDHTPAELYEMTATEQNYKKELPVPGSDIIVDIRDYGADEKNQDNTEAVQKALNALEGKGGTVYIPAGNWMFKGELTVPSGVELRGSTPVQQMQNKETTTGTIIWIYSGKDNEEGTPFISLEEGSGVRGFCVYYPEQNLEGKTVAYPWTVRALGENCWAVDITLTNSYNGLDFGTGKSNGFYIDFVGGSPVRRGIFVGNCDGEGWLQNCQFNPNYAYVLSHNSGNIDYRLYYCDAFIVGYVEKLNAFNLFEYGSKTGMLFISQNDKKANGNIINLGVDGTETSVRIWEAGNIEFVNPQLVAMESINQKTNILIEDTFDGTASFINSNVWGPTNTLLKIEGGTVNINLMNICTGYGEYALHTTGGKINMSNAIFHNLSTLIEGQTEALSLYGCYVRGYKGKIEINNQSSAEVENTHAWWS